MKNLLSGLMLLLPLFGCSSSEQANTSSDNQNKALSNAVKEPLDKARDAEKQVFDSAEQQKKQAEDL